MRQFRKKDVKAKSLRQSYESLLDRLEVLKQYKERYLSTFSNEQKAVMQQETQTVLGIKYENPFLEINGKKYDISKSEFHQLIIQDMEKLSIKVDNQASHIVNLRPMSSIEFYLLINSYNVNDNLHFGSTDICTICQFELFEIDDWKDYQKIHNNDQVVTGLPCDHYYHLDCLNYCIKEQHIQCPVCGKIYGLKTGDQPDGEMQYNIEYNTHCQTYENVGTIIINYVMHAGQRNGQYFPATYREAFLPDTPEGRQVFRLLKTAFERKLIFTVGRSVTTGKDNRIVWNGIHHKTSLMGGISCFGYPDPTYFNRVKEELAAKGVY